MLAFVEKNQKMPEFQEDFTEIRNDEILYFIYKKIKCLSSSYYKRNRGYIAYRKKVLGTGVKAEKLFQFLEKALEYQKNNLFWFSSVNWFNWKSAEIFEHFAKIEENKEEEQEEKKEEEQEEKSKILEKKINYSTKILEDFENKEQKEDEKSEKNVESKKNVEIKKKIILKFKLK